MIRLLRLAHGPLILAMIAGASGQVHAPSPAESVKEYKKPALVVHAYPAVQVMDIARGCSEVLLTARLVGPEDEGWYCPKVTWTMPNETTSVEESDCPPYEARDACWPEPAGPCAPSWRRDGSGRIVEYPECPCTVIGYPRTWRLGLCMPSHPAGEAWEVSVRLERAGRTLTRETVRFFVK